MKILYVALCLLAFTSVCEARTEIIVRTLPGKTLLQTANQIKNWLNRSDVSAAKYEDMLGDCMTPPIKSSTGIWYVRIMIPDNFLDNVLAAIPNATTCELVQVGGRYLIEIIDGNPVYVGEFS